MTTTTPDDPIDPASLSEDEIAAVVARLFADEFKLASVDVDAHFLFLGGDSLNAESLAATIGARFGLRFQTATLLDAPTPRDVAGVLAERLGSAARAPQP